MNNGETNLICFVDGFFKCEQKGCKTDSRKITGYLLKPGSHHYQEFIDVGYQESDSERLFCDIAANYSEDLKTEESITPFGSISFSIMMELGVTEKRTFRTVWEQKRSGDMTKLVTAYRDRRLENV